MTEQGDRTPLYITPMVTEEAITGANEIKREIIPTVFERVTSLDISNGRVLFDPLEAYTYIMEIKETDEEEYNKMKEKFLAIAGEIKNFNFEDLDRKTVEELLERIDEYFEVLNKEEFALGTFEQSISLDVNDEGKIHFNPTHAFIRILEAQFSGTEESDVMKEEFLAVAGKIDEIDFEDWREETVEILVDKISEYYKIMKENPDLCVKPEYKNISGKVGELTFTESQKKKYLEFRRKLLKRKLEEDFDLGWAYENLLKLKEEDKFHYASLRNLYINIISDALRIQKIKDPKEIQDAKRYLSALEDEIEIEAIGDKYTKEYEKQEN